LLSEIQEKEKSLNRGLGEEAVKINNPGMGKKTLKEKSPHGGVQKKHIEQVGGHEKGRNPVSAKGGPWGSPTALAANIPRKKEEAKSWADFSDEMFSLQPTFAKK